MPVKRVMRYSGYCRDYGGGWGLTCGYWARTEQARDRHRSVNHTIDEDVRPIDRWVEG